MYQLINGTIINKNTNKKIAEFKNAKKLMFMTKDFQITNYQIFLILQIRKKDVMIKKYGQKKYLY